MSNLFKNKSLKIEDITPDLDSVNIIGQILELQSIQSLDAAGNQIIVCNFLLADETGSIKTQLHKFDDLRRLKNGDIVAIKNGRVDMISHKLSLTNDIWSKFSILTDKKLENVNKAINISGIQYSMKPKQTESMN